MRNLTSDNVSVHISDSDGIEFSPRLSPFHKMMMMTKRFILSCLRSLFCCCCSWRNESVVKVSTNDFDEYDIDIEDEDSETRRLWERIY